MNASACASERTNKRNVPHPTLRKPKQKAVISVTYGIGAVHTAIEVGGSVVINAAVVLVVVEYSNWGVSKF